MFAQETISKLSILFFQYVNLKSWAKTMNLPTRNILYRPQLAPPTTCFHGKLLSQEQRVSHGWWLIPCLLSSSFCRATPVRPSSSTRTTPASITIRRCAQADEQRTSHTALTCSRETPSDLHQLKVQAQRLRIAGGAN